MDEKIISSNIKTLRNQKKITLQALSEITGLTKGYLSKVERSEKAPPYSTLTRIADALGVEVARILSQDMAPAADERLSISRGKNQPVIDNPSSFPGHYHRELARDKTGKNMAPFILHAPEKITKLYSHEGEELIYVTHGCLEFTYDDKTYVLKKGDSVYFDACVPHAGKRLGETPAELLVVIYFYRRHPV